MSITTEEKERVGVVVHLNGAEYQSVLVPWSFDIPDSYKSSLEALRLCRYVAFVVDGRMKSIGEIDRWSFEVGDDCKRSASFSLLSDNVEGLSSRLSTPFSQIHWLIGYQLTPIQEGLSQGAKQRPADVLPSFDIEEASKSVARRFSVDAEQVEITIRSKSALR